MMEDTKGMRSSVMPALRYSDAKAAIAWLEKVFGCTRHAVYEGPDGSVGHAELVLGGGMIMLGSTKKDDPGWRFQSPKELGGVATQSNYIVVEDADAVYARALAAGAEVVRPLAEMSYGGREFTVKDPEGHSWSAGTYDPWKAQS